MASCMAGTRFVTRTLVLIVNWLHGCTNSGRELPLHLTKRVGYLTHEKNSMLCCPGITADEDDVLPGGIFR